MFCAFSGFSAGSSSSRDHRERNLGEVDIFYTELKPPKSFGGKVFFTVKSAAGLGPVTM